MSGSLTVTGTVKGISSSIYAGYFDADYTSVYVYADQNYGIYSYAHNSYAVYGVAADDWSIYAAAAGNDENTFYCGGGSEFHGDMRIIGPSTTSDAKLNIDSGGADGKALIDFIDDDGARARIGFNGFEGAAVFNCIDPILINSSSIDSSSIEIEIQNDSVDIIANVDIDGDVDVEGTVSRDGFFMAYSFTGNQSFNGASEDIDFVNEKCEDNQYKHSTSTNPDEITLMETGWYKVSYNINFENDGTDRTDIRVGCVWNSTYQAGSYSFTYLRSGTFGDNGTCSATILINVTIAERVLKLISTGKYAGGSWGSGCNYHVTRDSCIVIEKVK